jgi:hypothetical protein
MSRDLARIKNASSIGFFGNPLFASSIKSKITANPANDGRSASASIGNSSMQVWKMPERRFDFVDPDFGSTE